MSLNVNAVNVADEIIDMLENYGHEEYAGEKVTQLEHMYQAALFAEKEKKDEEVILAALLHDIGHICVSINKYNDMDGFGVMDHELIGAEYLGEKGFSKRVIKLISSHVNAKRYLTKVNKEYYDQLSDASKKTLEFQGGSMTDNECMEFESDPDFDDIIRLRKWDDAAKVENLEMESLSRFREMIIAHLSK